MDNLTHSLIGAALGQAGLKRKTGLAMPALIIAANIPDIDAGCVVYGIESLAMRRGITHGPIALVLLPLLLAGALWWFDRWQTRRGTRPAGRLPVNFKWLLALCYIGCLTHPLFDWFNNYGIRLLEPFSSQWFYGDVLFIIDPWILAMLGAGVWFSLRRERAGNGHWAQPARLAVAGVAAFIAANFQISSYAVHKMRAHLQLYPDSKTLVVANAVPLRFWHREMLFRSGPFYGSGDFSLVSGEATERRNDLGGTERRSEDVDLDQACKADPEVAAFLFWSRMPTVDRVDGELLLRDQRFMDPRTAGSFSVLLRKPDTTSSPE